MRVAMTTSLKKGLQNEEGEKENENSQRQEGMYKRELQKNERRN